MPIETPNINQVKDIAASFGMDLSDVDAASFAGLMKGSPSPITGWTRWSNQA